MPPMTLAMTARPVILAWAMTAAAVAQPAAGARGEPAKPAVVDPVRLSEIRERALSLIQEASKNPDAQVRANAAEVAGFVPARLRAVIEAALDDPNEAVRTVGLMVIGRGKVADLTDRARTFATAASPYVRSAALFALAKNGREADISPLSDLLINDVSPRVRAHVAVILGELGNKSAMPLLRAAAAKAGDAASVPQAKLLELQIAEAMVKLGEEEQRQTIRAALYPSTPEELEATALAVQIIGLTKDKAAAKQLMSLDNYRDRQGRPYPAEVRLAIAGALAAMGDPRGVGLADEFAKDPNAAIRAQAAFVYGEGGTAYWPQLDALMNDPDGPVRVAAAGGVLKSWAKAGNR